jgi:NAD dependent epimerase/dehydratase family enzyme
MEQYGKEVKQLISASAIGFYGDQDERYLNESHIAGEGFLAKLCEDWEKQALMAESFLKVYIMRIGLYLHPEGALPTIYRRALQRDLPYHRINH